METWLIVIGLIAVAILGLIGLYLWAKRIAVREPYHSFLALPTRRKVSFFKSLLSDPRVPWGVKVLPFALVAYLAFPIDIVPDFIPVLGYVDDVALIVLVLVLVVRFTPTQVITELLDKLGSPPT